MQSRIDPVHRKSIGLSRSHLLIFFLSFIFVEVQNRDEEHRRRFILPINDTVSPPINGLVVLAKAIWRRPFYGDNIVRINEWKEATECSLLCR
jgi:hypothetical protein